MSKLRNRVANVGNNQQQAMGDYHPFGTEETPMVEPVNFVTYGPAGGTVERLTPMFTANGAMIPARPPGRYGHVAAAGRP